MFSASAFLQLRLKQLVNHLYDSAVLPPIFVGSKIGKNGMRKRRDASSMYGLVSL